MLIVILSWFVTFHVCQTQPRVYWDSHGQNPRLVVDRYISYHPCPFIPID